MGAQKKSWDGWTRFQLHLASYTEKYNGTSISFLAPLGNSFIMTMAHVDQMLAQAEWCEERAERARNPSVAWTLLEAAQHWRKMAVQIELLEREPFYQRLRDRSEPN